MFGPHGMGLKKMANTLSNPKFGKFRQKMIDARAGCLRKPQNANTVENDCFEALRERYKDRVLFERKHNLDNREVFWDDDRFFLIGDVDVVTFHRAKMNGSYGGSGIVDISERLRQGWLYANLYSASIGYFDGTEITYDQGNLGLYRSLPLSSSMTS